jgi:hypothetical protein
MIDKNSNQRIKKVLLNIVKKTRSVIQKVSSGKKGIRTSWRSVGFVKAFTSWSNSTIYNMLVVAYSSPGTVKWAKEVRARCAQPWTYKCLRQGTWNTKKE